MEIKRESVPVVDIIPVIKTAVDEGKPVEITVTGNSMRPLLLDRVSAVRLVKPGTLCKGDIVLFKRSDGHYVLHRIINIHEGLYDIVGDNQIIPDRNITEEKIIAKVAAYSRNGKEWKRQDRLYRIMLPLIKTARRCKRKLVRIIK